MDIEKKPLMDDQRQYILTFDNGSAADANRWASELKDYLLAATKEVKVEQQRDNPYSMDLGTTLSLILGAPSVIVVARALGNWLIRVPQTSITIKTPDGEIVMAGLTSKDALKLTDLFLSFLQNKKK